MPKQVIPEEFSFQKKKTVHINLKRETHGAFRAELFKHGLSMQETFEEFATLVGIEYAPAIRILKSLVEKKKNKQQSTLSSSDADEIYQLLEEQGAFSGIED